MPPEIADSDAESDPASPKAPAYSPILENADPIYAILSDPLDHVDFSQYLSPTQRLSSMIEQQENTVRPRSTGSTDRFLKEIDELNHDPLGSTASITNTSMANSANESARKRPKRRFSEIENGTERRPGDESHRGNGKKSKTYGSARSQMSDSASPLFLEAEFISKQGYGSKVPTIYSNNGLQGGHHSVSTTRSSMGGYQGYEMDFRGAQVGIDIGANPFGSLSQISADGEAIPYEARYLPGHIQQEDKLPEELRNEIGVDISLQSDTLMQMATSPPHSSYNTGKVVTKERSFNASKHGEASAASLADDKNTYHKTDKEDDVDTETVKVGSEILKSSEVVTIASGPKKRGRKPKNIQASGKTAMADGYSHGEFADDPDMPPKEQYKPRPSRSRASTVDSTKEASDIEAAGDNKRQRRRKPAGDAQPTQPSSELHLNDPQVIGAPLEIYNPRPSKSRTHRIVEDEHDQDFEQLERHAVAQEYSVLDVNLAQSETPAKSKKKSTKKGKTKQAKSAAAVTIANNMQEMVNEDDKDLSLLGSPPAETNTILVSHLDTEKEKMEPPLDDTPETTIREEARDNDPGNRNFTIDLPPANKTAEEAELPKPEPKKRGRKLKKKVEVLPEPLPQADVESDMEKEPTPAPPDSEAKTRQPLTEKDNNTPTPALTPSSTSSIKTPTFRIDTPPPPPQTTTTTKTASTSTPKAKPSTPLSSLIKPRVGLSRRTFIPPLLRKLDRTKEPPKLHEKKEKLSKKQKELEEKRKLENEMDGLDADEGARWKDRGADGMLVEWND